MVPSVVPSWPGEGSRWGLDATRTAPGPVGAGPTATAAPAPSTGGATAGRAVGAPSAAPATRPVPASGADVVVVRGDSLWSIAARHLPDDAPESAVASAWPRWWATNHAVVGDDPDVLLPGQVLRVPQDAR